METKEREAVSLFNSGCNCAQSVLLPFCEKYHMDKEFARKLCGGFGAGCRSGEICGAAAAAAMIIGLKIGEDKSRCNMETKVFMDEFRKRNTALTCRDILNHKKTSPVKTTCDDVVRAAVEMLEVAGY